MLKAFFFLFCVILVVAAKPLDDSPILTLDKDDQINTNNVITVPSKCPTGQKPDANGICKDVWTFGSRNVIVVPVVCPEGQEADSNGICRDVWKKL